MISVQMNKYHLNIDDKLDTQDLIRMGKKVEYDYDNFYLIKVFDYNENILFEKIIGYSLGKPKIVFFQNLNGFIIIRENEIIIYNDGIEHKIAGITPIVEIVSYKDNYFVIFENEIKRLSSMFQTISSHDLGNLLKNFTVEEGIIKIETVDSKISHVSM